jgi:glyoxylase-like metal-dependent hydrolase (beta-lactamase superfamily II)
MYGCRDNKWISLDNSSRTICPEASILLNEGDVLTLGETELRVIETPGHTGGGITFAADNITFTGDTLFRLSVGNTSLETGNWDTLVKSIKDKLYTLPDDTIVYPGHGPATTIGYEKKANPFV